MVDKWTVGLNKEGLYNGVKPPEEGDEKIERELLYHSVELSFRNNNLIIKLSSRTYIPSIITYSFLLGYT